MSQLIRSASATSFGRQELRLRLDVAPIRLKVGEDLGGGDNAELRVDSKVHGAPPTHPLHLSCAVGTSR